MNKILATVSAFALLSAMPALAETMKTQNEVNAEASTSGDISADAKEAWKDVKEDTSEAYEEIKATVIGEKATGPNASTTVTIDSRKTASGMIGKPVYNESGESVAKVTDIILDQSGKATMVVVADGEFVGMGKKAAFDYSAITRVNADGDVIMPISEETIDKAAAFSYDKDDASDQNTRVMPSNSYSVSALLDGQILDERREAVADVDNITFRNGRADQLILGFDKVLGIGGDKAAMDFEDAKVVRDGDALDFQLSNNQAAQFETYKKSVSN